MGINKDQVEGRVKEAKGKIKEVAGKLVGNESMEAKGKIQKNLGQGSGEVRRRQGRREGRNEAPVTSARKPKAGTATCEGRCV